MEYSTPALPKVIRMATPMIALRFRDVVQGIDTIDSHSRLISDHGYVWWGWWKKSFEDVSLRNIASIPAPFEIFLLDRSTTRMFRASVDGFHRDRLSAEELTRCPEYYRDQEAKVAGWFRINHIESIEYESGIANAFGDGTLVFLDSKPKPVNSSSTSKAEGRSCLLHLSDLHFGKDYDFLLQGKSASIGDRRKTLTECISEDLKRLRKFEKVGAIIVTGDFTTAGCWDDATRKNVLDEFAKLREVLGLKPDQIIAVPGNHDVVRYQQGANTSPDNLAIADQVSYEHEREFRTFGEELTGRHWQQPLNYKRRISFDEADLSVAVLNSCTIAATEWTEYGYVGEKGVKVLHELGTESASRATYRMMAVHHHLLPVSQIAAPQSKGVTLSLDATELLDEAQAAGIQVALHGHEHMPRLAKYQTVALKGASEKEPLLIVSNGSTGVGHSRRPGDERNTYCLFEFTAHEMNLWLRELRPDGKAGTSLYEGSVSVCPTNGAG